MTREEQPAQGNYISEWFGQRMYPRVVATPESLQDQRLQRCPFLSDAKGSFEECIKRAPSKGVCTISSRSNGPRQDWVVCPYRAFERRLLNNIAVRLYGLPAGATVRIFPAPSLGSSDHQKEAVRLVDEGQPVLVSFDHKLGGEIQVSASDRSPQVAFDTTFIELVRGRESLAFRRFAIMEIQTMDFHGSYKAAVDNLQHALRLHEAEFPAQAQANQRWLSQRIEGPNIANVFKRTFYQLMFKFEMARTTSCAGCALAIPAAVWDRWQPFLGRPTLEHEGDSVYRLGLRDGALEGSTEGTTMMREHLGAWIYVFDFDDASAETPSPMRIQRVIRTSAEALAYHALEEAPKGAIEELERGVYPALTRRLAHYWTIPIEIPAGSVDTGTIKVDEDPRPIEEIENID